MRLVPLARRTALWCATVACAVALLGGCGSSHVSRRASGRSHVVMVVMENKEDTNVLGNPQAPYTNSLARRYGLATASFAITHPSLPNYLALTSGSTDGVATDCSDCHVAAPNLVDELERDGVTWKAYMQDLPAPCFRGTDAAGYARRHDPFLYYDDVAASPARCRKVVPLTEIGSDLQRGALPSFAFIAPNLCSDTHDCGLDAGDRFLASLVPGLLPRLGPDGFLVLTWDEGSSNGGCCGSARGGHIATIVAGPGVRRGARDPKAVDHYGVLRTVQDALEVPPLGASADASNGTLAPLFRRPPDVN